jgi:outer membrane protein OmpA-like peptidoglycan-associated protein
MLLFPFMSLLAQEDWGCAKPNKKAEKLLEKARQMSFRGSESYRLLIEATKEDPQYAEAYSILAYLNSKKDQSNPQVASRTWTYHEKVKENCPAFRNYESVFWLAENAYNTKDYVQADGLLTEYLGSVRRDKGNEVKKAEMMKKQLDEYRKIFDNPVPFNPVKVDGASTGDDEYLPMLSPDNQFLFYTRKSFVDSKSVLGKQEKELFMQSRKKYDGSYSGGIPMPPPFNKGSYQGGSSISIDNKMLFITIVEQAPTRDGRLFSNGDIYYSEFEGGKWGELKSIGSHINGRLTWEGQPSISADKKTLYFASARGTDNYGGMDLYKVERDDNGNWGDPINLGPTINTAGNEKSPFMHSDSYTLYFSSDGHPGVGGQDIFFARINEFGQFDPPVNIGVPINTEEDEHGFMVSTDGAYGYFASSLGEKGIDIYNFKLPEHARPEEVVFVKGSISSKDPKAAEGMTIQLKNMETDQVVEGVVDQESGEYVAVISATEQQDVMMMAKKNGYAFTSQYIKSDKDLVGKPKRMAPMEFNPIEEGETYQINNITFATDSYDLSEQVMNILNEFIEFLEDNPSIRVAIQGHTDDVGEAEKNLLLSTNRAQAVFNYLILEGIDPARLEYKGYGETKPLASNKTAEGRAKNRRTEFVILSK